MLNYVNIVISKALKSDSLIDQSSTCNQQPSSHHPFSAHNHAHPFSMNSASHINTLATMPKKTAVPVKAPAKVDDGSDNGSSSNEKGNVRQSCPGHHNQCISLVVNTTTTDASLVTRKAEFYKEVDNRVLQKEHKTSHILSDETFDDIFKLMMSIRTTSHEQRPAIMYSPIKLPTNGSRSLT